MSLGRVKNLSARLSRLIGYSEGARNFQLPESRLPGRNTWGPHPRPAVHGPVPLPSLGCRLRRRDAPFRPVAHSQPARHHARWQGSEQARSAGSTRNGRGRGAAGLLGRRHRDHGLGNRGHIRYGQRLLLRRD